MPALQKQTQAVESELQSLKMAAVDEAKYLQLAETLTGFRSKLRVRAEALDIVVRQQNVFPVHLVVEQVETVVRFFLRFLVQLPLKHPDFNWCFQTHRQSPLLSFFKSTSEVRVLPSTGITRHQRYCDPLRLPGWPPSCDDVGDAISASPGSPPITQITFPTCRAQYPGGRNR